MNASLRREANGGVPLDRKFSHRSAPRCGPEPVRPGGVVLRASPQAARDGRRGERAAVPRHRRADHAGVGERSRDLARLSRVGAAGVRIVDAAGEPT